MFRPFIIIIAFLFINMNLLTASESIIGTYSGKLIYPDTGSSYPMKSIFKKNNKGQYWGSYKYKYQGKFYEGAFYKGILEQRDMEIFWTDEFGDGWLIIKFSDDFSDFTGSWGAIEKEIRHKESGKWTGTKIN